ncbi:MAG: transcriptional regulator [Tannerellaceae bacterium]|jgi:DNA-binding CsgD family transcriptional regulator|nr:transcriptional regulator [Tannerellaceae bacterium]
MKKLVLSFTLVALFPLSLPAQWNAFVNNYGKDLFGRGAKTWNIQIYDTNRIYLGNQKGLLEYNGNDWRLYPVDNQKDVRSVYISKRENRIYAGGDGEFGYFEPDRTGRLRYTRLSGEVVASHHLTGGYWGIYEIDNLTYYVSDRHIVKQTGDKFTVIHSEHKIDCSNIVNGVLLIGTTNGVRMLVGNSLLPVAGEEAVRGKTIRAIAPWQAGCLIATASDGLFYASGKEIVPFVTGVEEFMRRNEIFSLAVSSGCIAVGTIHKGLVLLGAGSRPPVYYNEQNGLQNNTILSLAFDARNNLWLGLDDGIDYIQLQSPFSNLYTSPNAYGSGYAALLAGNYLLLGTNRGLFYTQAPVAPGENPPEFRLIHELSGQVWGITKVNNDIFCLHDKGLYRLKENGTELIPGLRGALSCIAIKGQPGVCLVGAYEGLFLIKETNNKWSVRKKIMDGAVWLKNMAFLPPDILWIRALDQGIIRLQVDTADFSIKEYTLYDRSSGFDSIDELYLHQTGDSVFFSSASGIYTYDESQKRIIPSTGLPPFLADEIYPVLKQSGSHVYALSSRMIQAWNASSPGGLPPAVYPFNFNQIELIPYYESMAFMYDSLVIIPNGNGFALLNKAVCREKEKRELYMRNVYITHPKDSLIYTDNFRHTGMTPEIHYNERSLRLEYAVRMCGPGSAVKYRVRLKPGMQWTEYSPIAVKEYNNLKEGDYAFEAEALFADGSVSSASFSFTVLPPWYRSAGAWIAYLALFLLSIYLLYEADKRRILQNRKAEAAKSENEIRLKEQEIIKLNTEKLEQELTFKTQEQANLMMNISRKNEILTAIKDELYKIAAELKGESSAKAKRMLIVLNNSIDTNIASDNALKGFEEQFDLVHNNFTKKLKAHHPDLTVSELKMCMYVKMNLASKEIAPLLNLSVRGVETLRYRLRKKLNLEREDSLRKYLDKVSVQVVST